MAKVFEISADQDVLAARRAGKDLARALGCDPTIQTRLSTAISQLARSILQCGGSGRCALSHFIEKKRTWIQVMVEAEVDGIADLAMALGELLKAEARTGVMLEIEAQGGHTHILLKMAVRHRVTVETPVPEAYRNRPHDDVAQERRAGGRKRVLLEVSYEDHERESDYALNLSESGVFIATNAPFVVGETIEFNISPPAASPFKTKGVVRWRKPPTPGDGGGVGVEFVIDEDHHSAVGDALNKLLGQKPGNDGNSCN